MANSTDMFLSLIGGFNPKPNYSAYDKMNFQGFNPGTFGQSLIGTVNKGVKDYNTDVLLEEYMANADDATLMQLAQTNPEVAGFLLEKRKLDAELAPKGMTPYQQARLGQYDEQNEIARINAERAGQMTPYQAAQLQQGERDYNLRQQDTQSKIATRGMSKDVSPENRAYNSIVEQLIADGMPPEQANIEALKKLQTFKQTNPTKVFMKDGKVIDYDASNQSVKVFNPFEEEQNNQKAQLDKYMADFREAPSNESRLAIAAQIAALNPQLGNSLSNNVRAGFYGQSVQQTGDYQGSMLGQGQERIDLEKQRVQQDKQEFDLAQRKADQDVLNDKKTWEQRDQELAIKKDTLDLNRIAKEKGYTAQKLESVTKWRDRLRKNTDKERELLFRTNSIDTVLKGMTEGKFPSTIAEQKLLIDFAKFADPESAVMLGEAAAYGGTDSLWAKTREQILSGGASILTDNQIQTIKELSKIIKKQSLDRINIQKSEAAKTVSKYGIDPEDVTGILDVDLGKSVSPKVESLLNRKF